jgi:hypothetical protein
VRERPKTIERQEEAPKVDGDLAGSGNREVEAGES